MQLLQQIEIAQNEPCSLQEMEAVVASMANSGNDDDDEEEDDDDEEEDDDDTKPPFVQWGSDIAQNEPFSLEETEVDEITNAIINSHNDDDEDDDTKPPVVQNAPSILMNHQQQQQQAGGSNSAASDHCSTNSILSLDSFKW